MRSSARERTGGLSEPKLGDKFVVHARYGTPRPRCGDTLRRASYESYEVTYCPTCQTGASRSPTAACPAS